MNDDVCERVPLLIYGVITWRTSGYPLATCC